MKSETKSIIEKVFILFAPIFTFIMYFTPSVLLLKEKTVYGSTIFTYQKYGNYLDVLKSNGNVITKIIMIVSLIGVIGSLFINFSIVIFKEKEKKLMKLASIVLLVSSGILLFTNLLQLFYKTSVSGARISAWVDFFTPLYGVLLVYNVAVLIYVLKKLK